MDSPSQPVAREPETMRWKQKLLLSYHSLGIVFGHLSIGPLYVYNTVPANEIKSEEMLFGFLSFIFWTMTLISLVKYAFIVLRVDDNGEGGIFALYSILRRNKPDNSISDDTLLANETESFYQTDMRKRESITAKDHERNDYLMLLMALIGSSMAISTGVLVPSLSVYTASVGFDESIAGAFFKSPGETENFEKYVVLPTACTILVALFVLQHYGTSKIGFLFAPIIVIWLLFISGVGLYNIVNVNPHVIVALSPTYIYKFMKNIKYGTWRSLSGILLSIAGSEAMFADLGHLSKKSIKAAFILLVYPSLVLCYMGQTAYMSKLEDYDHIQYATHLKTSMPKQLHQLFSWLSLLASVVGSQATITATFSIINQCIALGCFPKMTVVHTSDKIKGQIYIPDINWILMLLLEYMLRTAEFVRV